MAPESAAGVAPLNAARPTAISYSTSPRREQVRPGVEILVAQLFGRHVGDRSDRHARVGQRSGARARRLTRHTRGEQSRYQLRQTEVKDLRAVRSQEDIGGLDVAMNDARRMRGHERIGQLQRQVDETVPLYGTACEALLQRLALEQFHRDKWRLGTHIVDCADVRMVQGRRGLRFTNESLEVLWGASWTGCQQLERDQAAEAGVTGAIDSAHATGCDERHDLVGTEPGSGSEPGGVLQQAVCGAGGPRCETAAVVIGEQRRHIALQIGIVGARRPHEAAALSWWTLQRRGE